MANNVAIKTIADCTELQKKLIAALTSDEARSIRKTNDRWRWAMQQAGYSENTALVAVQQSLQPVMGEIADLILARASVDAAMHLADVVGGGEVDAHTKDRSSAANTVLDRVVPKKETKSGSSQAPVAVIILPAKNQTVQLVEAKESDDDTSTS